MGKLEIYEIGKRDYATLRLGIRWVFTVITLNFVFRADFYLQEVLQKIEVRSIRTD